MASAAAGFQQGFAAGCMAAGAAGLALWAHCRWYAVHDASPSLPETSSGGEGDGTGAADFDAVGLEDRVLRKAETVLARRTARWVVVIERCSTDHNHSAIIRTAEALGCQHVWLIAPPAPIEAEGEALPMKYAKKARQKAWEDDMAARRKHGMFARRAQQWITIREFDTTAECIEALRADGRVLWVTDLSQQADCLSLDPAYGSMPSVPAKMAIVFGSEAVGVSDTMLAAADRRVYLPLHGFADSLNLSVSTALVLQLLFALCPEAVGDLVPAAKAELRRQWYATLARDQEQLDRYNARLSTPPAPLADLRRADGHRTGWRRKTDRAHMAGVADYRT